MKKFTIMLCFLLAFADFARSQVIEDFEHIKLNVMFGGAEDNSEMRVVPNPDKGDANPSNQVVRFHRSRHGVPWGGFWSRLAEPIDLTEHKYVYVKVWKSRISPLKFKVEDGPSANLEIVSMKPQTKVNEWEELVFDFSSKSGKWNVIAFMPDFNDPVNLDEDIVIFFDDIRVGGPPPSKSQGGYIVENFEHIPLNWFAAGDDAYMHVVANPDPENEVNPSHHVVEFSRGKGDPWGGFFSPLAAPLDLTENKYIYVDVWKPMISRVVFKLEASVTGALNVELPSMQPQSKTEEWETLVFDFSEVGGQWNTITFFPDFPESADGVAAEYIKMYFDNIRQGGPPEEEPGFKEVDFVWVDFETPRFTNVEGFRDPSSGTVATDLPGLGVDSGAVVKLEYKVSEEELSTSYRMWAFPSADVSKYNMLVLHVKAEEPVDSVTIQIRDTQVVQASTKINIGKDWQQIIIPISELKPLNDENTQPDLTILQGIFMTFNHGQTKPEQGIVYIDLVGFIHDVTVSVPKIPLAVSAEFQVFPNPAKDYVTVRTNTGDVISLFDISGNLISSKTAPGDDTVIDLSGLARGLYLIRVIGNNQSGSRKLIVY